MTPLQAFDLGRKVGRAEKSAEGTRYQEELQEMAFKAREAVING